MTGRFVVVQTEALQRDPQHDLSRPRGPVYGEALMQLLGIEGDLDDKRRAGDAGYSVSRHVEVLSAMMGEARLLRSAPRPSP